MPRPEVLSESSTEKLKTFSQRPHVADVVLAGLQERIVEQDDILIHPIIAGQETHSSLGNGYIMLAASPTTPIYDPAALSTLMHDVFSFQIPPDIMLNIDDPKPEANHIRVGIARFTQTGRIVDIPVYDISHPDPSLLQTIGFQQADVVPKLSRPTITGENYQIVEIFWYPHPEMATWVGRNFQRRDTIHPNQLKTDQALLMRGIISARIVDNYKKGNYLADL